MSGAWWAHPAGASQQLGHSEPISSEVGATLSLPRRSLHVGKPRLEGLAQSSVRGTGRSWLGGRASCWAPASVGCGLRARGCRFCLPLWVSLRSGPGCGPGSRDTLGRAPHSRASVGRTLVPRDLPCPSTGAEEAEADKRLCVALGPAGIYGGREFKKTGAFRPRASAAGGGSPELIKSVRPGPQRLIVRQADVNAHFKYLL